jgi:hypothetical protein
MAMNLGHCVFRSINRCATTVEDALLPWKVAATATRCTGAP